VATQKIKFIDTFYESSLKI